MGLINWIFDFYQHSKIEDARQEASSMRAELASLRRSGGDVDSARLEQAIGELALATKTLQRILIEKHVCTPEEFGDAVRQIDMEDGHRDGRSPL